MNSYVEDENNDSVVDIQFLKEKNLPVAKFNSYIKVTNEYFNILLKNNQNILLNQENGVHQALVNFVKEKWGEKKN